MSDDDPEIGFVSHGPSSDEIVFADANGGEAPHIELLKDAADFIGRTKLGETDLSVDRAEHLVTELGVLIEQERHGIKADHPLVRCDNCGESATRCDFGNAYCPSCGDPLDGMPEVKDA